MAIMTSTPRFVSEFQKADPLELSDIASSLGEGKVLFDSRGNGGIAVSCRGTTKISWLPRLTCHVGNRRRQLGCIFLFALRFVILPHCDSAAQSFLEEGQPRCQVTMEPFAWQVHFDQHSEPGFEIIFP